MTTPEDAMSRLRQVFAERPRPVDVQFCHHCFEPAEMAALLAKEPAELGPDELYDVLFSAYSTWGDWPALAHYVPRLFELRRGGRIEDDMLYYKLVIAEGMTEAERAAIVGLVAAELDSAVNGSAPLSFDDALDQALAFLALFDPAFGTLLARWRATAPPLQWASLVARLMIGRAFSRVNCYMPKREPLPENVAAIAAATTPADVIERLGAVADRLDELAPYDAALIEQAFDYACVLSRQDGV